ncbi:uncharacterized protein [Diadema setosum]|uniref:uncharacterized protein n=1 Tax=Diadema setosum TaxID=31175 RepID=UPI003B3B1AEF
MGSGVSSSRRVKSELKTDNNPAEKNSRTGPKAEEINGPEAPNCLQDVGGEISSNEGKEKNGHLPKSPQEQGNDAAFIPDGNTDEQDTPSVVAPVIATKVRAVLPEPKRVSGSVRKIVDSIVQSMSHWTTCETFPCEDCCTNSEEVEKISQRGSLDREAISDHLADSTDFCQLFSETWERLQFDCISSEEETIEGVLYFNFYICLLGSVWNFTDNSSIFCAKMEDCQCNRHLIDWMLSLEDESSMNKSVKKMVLDTLNILHNVVRRIPLLRERCRDVLPALEKFGESPEDVLQTCAFLTMSYVIRKDESHKVSLNEKCLATLLTLLRRALYSHKKDHKITFSVQETETSIGACMSFSALELIQGIEQLAINDDNKALIAKKDGISIIGKMLGDRFSVEERTGAANTLWRLAFSTSNKEDILKRKSLVEDLTKNAKHQNETLKNAAKGALFEIYGSKLPEELGGAPAATQDGTKGSPTEGGLQTNHIMISYKWENPAKPVMREIKQRLKKRGYNVWMDEDHMSGDKIGAMAEAVENADIVLACISPGYQDSQDCRSEASYAYECKKKIVPIKVDPKFNPSRWLGGIVAGKIYYVVQSVPKVPEVLSVIIEKEIGDMGKKRTKEKSVDEKDSAAPKDTSTPDKPEVTKWGVPEVQEWLSTNGITSRSKHLKNLNGKQLLQLKKQRSTVPDFFFKSLKDELKLDFSTVLSLTAALDTLED